MPSYSDLFHHKYHEMISIFSDKLIYRSRHTHLHTKAIETTSSTAIKTGPFIHSFSNKIKLFFQQKK